MAFWGTVVVERRTLAGPAQFVRLWKTRAVFAVFAAGVLTGMLLAVITLRVPGF